MSRSVLYTSSPLLASKTPVWRSRLVLVFIAAGFLALVGRAAWVQVIKNDFFQRQGEVRFARTLELPANRGRILDRNGVVLATNYSAYTLEITPAKAGNVEDTIEALSHIIDIAPRDKRRFSC